VIQQENLHCSTTLSEVTFLPRDCSLARPMSSCGVCPAVRHFFTIG